MKPRDIIVIGTSAGGFSALKKLLPQLPPDLPATIFVVQHLRSAVEKSTLPRIVAEQASRSDDQDRANDCGSVLREAEKRVHLIQQVLNHGTK